MNRWFDLILKCPRTVIAGWIIITILIGWNILKLKIEPDIQEMLPDDFAIVTAMDAMDEIFGGSEIVVVSISSDNIFSEKTLTKIAGMTADIEALPYIDRVVSLTYVEDIIGSVEGFEVHQLIPELPVKESELEAIKDRISGNELLNGVITSKDFKNAAIIVMLNISQESYDDEQLYQDFNQICTRYENPEVIYMAGYPLTRRAVAATMQRDVMTLFPYGVVLMILFLVLSFRSWIGAFLPFITLILVVANTIGVMALLKIKFTIVGMMVPVMLIAVTSSYSIHILSQYFNECLDDHRYGQKNATIKAALNLMTVPVFLSGLTTLIGFLSLQSHVLPAARELGILVSIGIVLAFFINMTFLPAALVLLPFPQHLQGRSSPGRLNRLLNRWGGFITRHSRGFLIAVTLVVIAISLGIWRIKVDTNPVYFWDAKSEIRKSNDFINRHFGGSSQLSILAEGDIKSPDFLRKMEKLSDYLRTQQRVTSVTSIVEQLKLMNRAFHSDSAEYYRIPDTREEVAQYLFLYTISGDAENLDQFVDYDYGKAQITARILETGSAESYRLYLNILQYIKNTFDKSEFPSVTGMAAFTGTLADMVITGQIRSLIISIVLVCLATALIFRSPAAGLLSILPLASALIIIFGLMGYSHINLDMATVMISSIMIGVGIDYTIHFLYRCRLEMRNGLSAIQAIPVTLQTSGKGILYNGLSVMVGFVVFLLSGFLPIYFFGFLIVISILVCLMSALSTMPALLMISKPRFLTGKKGSNNE
jgi:hydrophobe/amphiphile efflux-3 (HAE3) family protein